MVRFFHVKKIQKKAEVFCKAFYSLLSLNDLTIINSKSYTPNDVNKDYLLPTVTYVKTRKHGKQEIAHFGENNNIKHHYVM